jgi:ABC-2 type transport system permease protein
VKLTTAHLLRHELRLLVRSRAAAIVACLIVVVFMTAAWNGARWVGAQRATIARVQSADARLYDRIYAQLDALDRHGDPRPALQLAGMAWYIMQPDDAVAPAPHIDPRRAEAAASEWVGARHAVLPPAPFAALAVGQSDLYPFYTRVTIRTRPILVQSDEIENPVNLLSGRFDLAFALTFCWPLLMLPLLYNVLSEEREAGTLALLASQPVSLRSILAIRLIVRGGLGVALALVTSLVSLELFTGFADVDRFSLALWGGAVAATALFWCGLAALVNVAGWRSAANATILTACWLGFAIVMPTVIGEIASAAFPVPSRVELVNAVRRAGNLTSSEVAALASTYYEEHPDTTQTGESADVTAIRGLAQQDAVDRRIDPIVSVYRAAAARQQRLVDILRFVSPPLLIYDAITELAGTTTVRYRRFAEEVDVYHRKWRAYFYRLVHQRTRLTRAHYEQAPRFAFEDESPNETRSRVLRLLLSASLSGLLLLGWAHWRGSHGTMC